MALFQLPGREYLLIIVVVSVLAADFFLPVLRLPLFAAAFIGALPTAWGALRSLSRLRINIDVFNIFAVAVSFMTGELRSAAFIVLMLTSARILDWHTESRTRGAVAELLKLKPERAIRERGAKMEEIDSDKVAVGDVIVAEAGSRVPVDGTVVFGEAFLNEASVTGESVPVAKAAGDAVIGGTLVESGTLKFRAERVGKDSTVERMAELMRSAAKNKSHSEKLADRFAAVFLPLVALTGAAVYFYTRNILMTAALFLVACADDMAVAIPLAVMAALGRAAKRGVIVKGGEWLNVLGKTKVLVLDKTGTLTYGSFSVKCAHVQKGIPREKFWKLVGVAEKFSEHPVGRAVFREAKKEIPKIPDPEAIRVYKGSGVWAKYGKDEVVVGNEEIFNKFNIRLGAAVRRALSEERSEFSATSLLVFINKRFAGLLTAADIPRREAKESLATLKNLGIGRMAIFTGDNEKAAAQVARELGVGMFYAAMRPEDKIKKLESLLGDGPVVMVGDGINDAPVLARADVGIAMGRGGAAVAVEAADVVILTDNLSRLPEIVSLGRRTASVIRGDMIIWLLTNVAGFALVLTGLAGPALAAFYNFATDFLPLMNSARLFRGSNMLK